MDISTPAEKQLAQCLNVIATIHMILLIVGAVLIYLGQGGMGAYLTQTPLDTNAVASLGIFALLAWFAAGDVRRFRMMIYALIFGFALEAVGAIVLLLNPNSGESSTGLIALAVFGVVMALVLVYFAQRAAIALPKWTPWMPDKALTGWEQFGRVVCLLTGALAVIAFGAHYVLAADAPAGFEDILHQFIPVHGSAIKIGMLGLCALVAAWDIRRYREFLTVFVLGNMISMGIVILAHFGMNRLGVVDFPALGTNSRSMMLGALLIDVSAVSGFIILKFLMDRSLLDHTRFFAPIEFRALEATAETLVEGGDIEGVPPEQIVLRTDDYLSSFPSKRLWLAKLAIVGLEFMPLLWFMPPISFLSPILRREFIDRNFKRDIVEKRGIYALLASIKLDRIVDFIEGMMRFNMQLTYIGYYSNPAVQEAIGYKPFSQRPEGQGVKPVRRYPALNVITPQTLRQRGIDTLTADVVIIGSGAAGAILAEQLSETREVLVIEKGPYVPPDEFTEDEVTQISKLYADGALQISQSLRFTVLQGSCVGGTTVVNNAVCFDTPDEVLGFWNEATGLNAGIDEPAFKAAQQAVRTRMRIHSIRENTTTRPWEDVLNPGDRVITGGVDKLRETMQNLGEYEVVEANITDCVGCGYCNIGCKYGRKLSMLDEVLPSTQQKHGDKFRILSEAEVVKLDTSGRKVTAIHIRLRDGRALTIQNPKTVIVSAGTIASSWLLMQSGIGAGELPVGKYLSFNMGSPIHGLWDENLNSFAGLQIAHYLRPPGNVGYVFETWYNPPIAQALAMPGWLDTHFNNMRNYSKMAGVGVLVGSEPTAHLTRALFLRGAPDIVYSPSEGDMHKLVDALVTLGKIMFEGGAKAIFASTRHYRSYESNRGMYSAEDADEFDADLRKLVVGERDILLGTGHPQGGNRISKTPGQNGQIGGVVSPEFKVYGYDNLYVCDASVFPGATTVNPQLTVMTMGRYAAGMIQ